MADKEKDIVARAVKNFKSAMEWEDSFRQRFKDDMRFLSADSDNHDQWDPAVKAARTIDSRPIITINKTHTHWLHVVNHMKENMPMVRVVPVGGEATYESAQIFEGIVRHIQYISDAGSAYETAAETQVGGGVGYFRLVTDYADEDSFDQEIYIKRVSDVLSVVIDPFAKEKDRSDARWGGIYEDMPRSEFDRKYPDVRLGGVGDDFYSWVRKDTVRLCEYYEVEVKKEWLYSIPTDDGGNRFMRESQMTDAEKKLIRQMMDDGTVEIDRRRVDKRTVYKYLIAGNKIVEKGIWPGAYIPIIVVPGEEFVKDNKLDRKGLVRYLKDAQRSYNYNAAASLEYGALQGKMPYMAPVRAIEGVEDYWATANTKNHSILPYNDVDENGNPVAPPQRQQPPQSAPAYFDGMRQAEHELMMASGQYEATFSEQGNEISGIAISNRKNQGERVTFHFVDNMAMAIRFLGKQLIDLIPKIYDTRRVIRIMAEDGTEQTVQIDPKLKQAMQQQENQKDAEVQSIFNPSVGKYDVIADVGASYETKRKEAFDAMTQILGAQPQLAQVIGDLYFGSGDFALADKLQERMRNWIDPSILGDAPPPAVQQMQQQLQQYQQAVQVLQQQLQDKTAREQMEMQRLRMDELNHLAIRMEDERKGLIDAFKAETDRLAKLLPLAKEEELKLLAEKNIGEMMQSDDPAKDFQPDVVDPSVVYATGLQSEGV